MCTYVQVFLSTPIIFPEGANFYQKLPFWRFLVPYGHSFKATTLKFRTTVRSLGSLPKAKFCKNRLREYTILGKCIPQISNFGIFLAVSPHLLSQHGKIWRENANLWTLPCQILEKSLKGIYPFGENLYQKLPMLAILGAVSLHFQSETN